ncbi:MAG TPA: right-handed parallel beta-helix repeat-containing protein [bacterium]|nr:right-handed parallel beta-helix repeat-containing protein [bacterium]HPN35657.1 right-handed parallel beta-helix repeat-containing protein [bacterium]
MKRIKISFVVLLFAGLLFSSCSEQTVALYVAPGSGTGGNGTKEAPFNSLSLAQKAVRSLRKERPGVSVVVEIKGGVYELQSPWILTAEDAGTEDAPVVYRAARGDEPVFTGSRPLARWRRLSDPRKLHLLTADVREKVYVTEVKSAGILDLGDPTEAGKRPELFCNGRLQTLARWPNSGFVQAGLAKGKTILPPTYINKRGTVEGLFEYTDSHQDRWAEENDVRLCGYWYWDWCDAAQKVKAIDPLKKLIEICPPYHGYGYRDSLRYFGFNLFSEIDQPGEWYLDRSDGLLYWYPPEGTDPNGVEPTLSAYTSPYMVELQECSYLTLQGLTFQEGRGSAILVRGGEKNLISDCRIERFGQDGIHVQGGAGHGISGCLLADFGCGGIKLQGGDRRTLTPAGHFVEHTVVEHFSLFKRTYEPAVHMDGCGMRLRNNRFRFSSSSAMRLEGNDFIIEYNQISRVVDESDDQGGLDIFYNPSYRGNVIRYNHWSEISGGTHHGAAGVRLDDMISGVVIYGNVFERCGARDFGGVQIHGGKDNLVENNLFYHCTAAVSFSSWGRERWLKQLDSPVITKKIYEDVDIRSAVYQQRYPELKTLRENPDWNTVKNNLLVACENVFLRDPKKGVAENNPSLRSGGKSVQAFCSARELKPFGLKPIPFDKMGPKKNRWVK